MTTNDRVGVFVPLWAMEECGGDARDAMVLAQITWWLQPRQADGAPRTTRIAHRDGLTWLVMTDERLAAETGLSVDQTYRARLALKRLGILEWQVRKVDGTKATLLRPVVHREPAGTEDADSRDGYPANPPDTPPRDIAECTYLGPRLEDEETTARARDTRTADRAESTARFDEHFWPAYPARNGRKLDKGKAITQWLKLSIDDQRAAVKGARNYAGSGQIPKDAHRWLRDRCWEDWQLSLPVGAPAGNGGRVTRDQQVMAATDEVRRRFEERESR